MVVPSGSPKRGQSTTPRFRDRRNPFQVRREGPSMTPTPHLARELWEREVGLLHERRHGQPRGTATPTINEAVGLAFSGGGIRSATISVGILQGLARQRLLRFVDYVSTV